MKKQIQEVRVEVTWESLIRILAFVVGIWLAVTLREVLVMLFGVFIFVAAVNPTISKWQKHMSRLLAVSLFYAIVILTIAIVTSVFIPNFIRQLNELISALPEIIQRIRPLLSSAQPGSVNLFDQGIASIQKNLDGISQGLLQTTLNVFGGLATFATGLVISFYLLLEERNARDFFHQVLPHHRFEAVYDTVNKISERMGSWVRGQVLLMAIIGLSNLVVYVIIGVPSPLPLAIWAGLCEAIPFVGPLLGVIPALIVVLTTGTLLQAVLVVLLGFVLIQQLEAHIVVPKVMERALGLSPVLVILSLTVGANILGLTGALMAIPIAAIISVVVGEWSSLRRIWEERGGGDD